MIILKSTTQDKLMHVHLDNEKFCNGHAPIQYSPNVVRNNIFQGISKEAQNATQQSFLMKNQRTHAINDIQSQMIASKIPLCLVQDIYGKLHQLVYMIPQNLYDQFSSNVQTGKKVTLRSHYETLQNQKNDKVNTSESKESYSCSVNIKDQSSQRQCLTPDQTNKESYRAQQHEALNHQHQILLQHQNHQQQMFQYQIMQLEYQKQQHELQNRKQQQQQVQHQQQLHMQYRQQSPQNFLLSFESQSTAHSNTSSVQGKVNLQELQTSPRQNVLKHQDQELHIEIPLQQKCLKANVSCNTSCSPSCNTRIEEVDFLAELQNDLKKKTPDNSYELLINKSSDRMQSSTLDKLDLSKTPNKSNPLNLNQDKPDSTNEQSVCNVDLQIDNSLRKRKNSTRSDFESEIKKSNSIVDSPKIDFNEMFVKISPTSDDTSIDSSDTSASDESQDLLWNLFMDEISSTSNDSDIFISEDFDFFDNEKHKTLDESFSMDFKESKDYSSNYSSRNDNNNRDHLDQFDLFQHILM
ncbi:TPR-containing protein DDB_G0280363 [Hydra vulgaris]|uniref:TPR-containing protein DDB_G0280363 n=1 Tax=Hydra vulgaris TaxID=6087 RepID=A0ABM4CJ27_HYDVU